MPEQSGQPGKAISPRPIFSPRLLGPPPPAVPRTLWQHGAVQFLGAALLSAIVVAVVVTSVCLRYGCGSNKSPAPPEDSINRLIVNFDTVGKTVKSFVPPLLYDYLEEQFLTSSGIQVVTFPDAVVLAQVRKLIESQPDLANLLQDQKLAAPPVNDVFLSNASRRLSSLLERRALQSGATDVNYETSDETWQRPFIDYSGAWSITEGVPSVVVAVIDTGCDLTHPDLKGNIWNNPGEIAGNNVDDDGNGYIDDAFGYDFAGNCGNDWRSVSSPGCGAKPSPQDPRGHGTHCAGIVAALHNSYGVVGIAPKVKIMCLKVAASDSGAFFTSHILKAYDYALRMGAHVVSCSFGPSQPNENPSAADVEAMWTEARLYRTALAPLVKKNMLIVAASGNEHYTLDKLDKVNSTYNPCFMAREYPDNMLCVSATDQQDRGWYEIASNIVFGTNNSTKYVDLGAPGRQILSTVPQLQENGFAFYDTKTGSSMATPMVAGVGALILSILGAGSGNYFQGLAAKRILLESATILPGLATRGSSRLNASAALRQARASLTGMKVLIPQVGFDEGSQSVMMAGFNETYFAGNIGLDDQDFSRLTVFDASMRVGVSRFEGYKYGTGYTVIVRASIKFTQSGVYVVNVSTAGNASDIVVKLGQSVIAPLNSRVPLTVGVGWYEFQLRYRNPVATVDVKLAEPGAGSSTTDFKYLSTFYTTTPNPPRSYYYAPNIVLSSAFQVLTRPNAGAIRRNSILDGPFPLLQLDQPYNYSSVVEDLSFSDSNSALRDALYPPASGISPAPSSVVGIVHTRIRQPEVPMRFRVTCQLCSLFVNTLQVLDVYDPLGGMAANSRVSGCMTFDRDYATHDLVLRFALVDTSAAPLNLAWIPCDSAVNTQASSITTHVASNLLWKPSSGVAGYVPGMQCDVWPDTAAVKAYPYESQPLLKFRLPIALGQSAKSLTNLTTFIYGNFTSSGCRTASESFSGSCSSSASFKIQDIYQTFPLSTALLGTPLASVYMRCYTYVNRGFATGSMQARTSSTNTIYAFLGSQSVFRADAVKELQGPYNSASVAANRTSMQGYYQLLAMEWRAFGPAALVGILDGVTTSSASANFALDMRNTLLPIPVAVQRQAVKIGQKASARGLLQAGVSSAGYAPVALGSSAWDFRQVGSAGLTAVFYKPDAAAPSEMLPGMSGIVVNSLAGSAVLSVTTAAGGLLGSVAGPGSNAGATRYARADGFLRSPTPNKGDNSMASYVLRVKDGDSQAITITMGNITVRNSVEFPAKTVTETRVEVMLPVGYVPTLVTVKSSRPDANVAFDMGLVSGGQESPIDRSLWYSNTDSTAGK